MTSHILDFFKKRAHRLNNNSFYLAFIFSFLFIFLLSSRPQNGVVMLKEPEVHRIPVKDVKQAEPEKKKLDEKWDTMDGIGYKFNDKDKAVKLSPLFEKLQQLDSCDLTKDKPEPRVDLQELMDEFQKCIRPIVDNWKNDVEKINSKWENTVKCDSLEVFKKLNIIPIDNLHETKWTILPICKENNTMVTLGVGHDTMAEEKLNITLPDTTFYGADPIIDPNRQLYSAFGKFFPFAIGKKPGFTKFRVLPNQNQKTRKYEYQDVTTIPLSYFLSDILGLKRIDISWIDIEGGEFQFLDQFHRGGELDEKKISICQFNLEVHSAFYEPGAQIFHDFVFRVLEEKRYIFLKPARTVQGVHRMFFVNVEDKECVRKFLQ